MDPDDVSSRLFQELLHIPEYKLGPHMAELMDYSSLCAQREYVMPRIELGLFRLSVLFWYYLSGPQMYVLNLPNPSVLSFRL